MARPTPVKAGSNGPGTPWKGSAQSTKDALGYEQVRRELAKKLGVDPYTTNPVLAKKLDEIATTAFRARVGVNTAISVFVPASIILTGVRTTDDLVWDTPRGDLIVRVEDKLQELQVPKAQITAFTAQPRHTLESASRSGRESGPPRGGAGTWGHGDADGQCRDRVASPVSRDLRPDAGGVS